MQLTVTITLLVAFIGGIIGDRLKITAGPLLGAMFAVAYVNFFLMSDYLSLPSNTALILQLLAGTMIGLQINKDTIKGMHNILLPTALVVAITIIFSISSTLIMYKFAQFSFTTSWLMSAPGRIQDMLILSSSLDAHYSVIILSHLIRTLLIILLIPCFFAFYNRGTIKQVNVKDVVRSGTKS